MSRGPAVARRRAPRVGDADVGDGDVALEQGRREGAVAEGGDDAVDGVAAQGVEEQQQALLRAAQLAAGVDEQDFHWRGECIRGAISRQLSAARRERDYTPIVWRPRARAAVASRASCVAKARSVSVTSRQARAVARLIATRVPRTTGSGCAARVRTGRVGSTTSSVSSIR